MTNTTTLILGNEAGSTGTYNLQLNGILSTNNTIVGNFGTGIFNQTGGTHTVTNDLSLGHETTGSGTYNLQNGMLKSNHVFVGYDGTGTFIQTGGTHTVTSEMALGANASTKLNKYDLQGGDLVITGTPATQTPGYRGCGLRRVRDFFAERRHPPDNRHFGLGGLSGQPGQLSDKQEQHSGSAQQPPPPGS